MSSLYWGRRGADVGRLLGGVFALEFLAEAAPEDRPDREIQGARYMSIL